ncbi:MAG: SDR family NAD(P)-dependent oxidoreductase [Rhodocyclaceae bacterium]|nr:SDR family NAD(P)-dependent oxidoreductase [Rhodocyclaceae bacterium]
MFKDKVAVITGAGSGIGRALALNLGARGARLALSDINAAALDETLAMFKSAGGADGMVRLYVLNVASAEAVLAHAEDVKRDFGTAHFLFNNAGASIVGTVNHTSIAEFEWQLGINMWGVLYGTKAFLPMMLAQCEGCIVNISSIFGMISFPTQGAYNMSKFAVRGLTECLWSELDGTGVRAVSVHPGGISTNIGKVARKCAAAGAEEAMFDGKAEQMLLTPPAECAANIIKGVINGDRRVVTGHRARTVHWMSRLFPNYYPQLLKKIL